MPESNAGLEKTLSENKIRELNLLLQTLNTAISTTYSNNTSSLSFFDDNTDCDTDLATTKLLKKLENILKNIYSAKGLLVNSNIPERCIKILSFLANNNIPIKLLVSATPNIDTTKEEGESFSHNPAINTSKKAVSFYFNPFNSDEDFTKSVQYALSSLGKQDVSIIFNISQPSPQKPNLKSLFAHNPDNNTIAIESISDQFIQTALAKAIGTFSSTKESHEISKVFDGEISTKHLLKLAAKSFIGLSTNSEHKANKTLFTLKLPFVLTKNTTRFLVEYMPTIAGEGAHSLAKKLMLLLDGLADRTVLHSLLAIPLLPIIYLLNTFYLASKIFVWLVRCVTAPIDNIKTAWNNWPNADGFSWFAEHAPWVGKGVAVASCLVTIVCYTMLAAFTFPYLIANAGQVAVPVLGKALQIAGHGISQFFTYMHNKPIVQQARKVVEKSLQYLTKKCHLHFRKNDTAGAVVLVAAPVVVTGVAGHNKLAGRRKKRILLAEKTKKNDWKKPTGKRPNKTLSPFSLFYIKPPQQFDESVCSALDPNYQHRSPQKHPTAFKPRSH